ncbi:MAG: serine/threonine-protein kinase [Chloroflexi bacterium]|nr:serine/threonine-protein kinase [Chloroflexota bacterium]
MEFIEGESLAGIIERAAPLAPAVGLPLAVQLCRGLAYAHDGGVVHRDVKPQNVLVTPAGQVKIVDFGIARGPAAHGLTEPGWVLGTAHYMAPEAAAGKPVGAAADLYAVGVVLYRLFTGRLPFVGDDPFAVAMLHRTAPPPLPSEVCPGLPPALEALLLQLLEKEPERRPVSAAAVAVTLADIGRGVAQPGTAAFDEATIALPVMAGMADTGATTTFLVGEDCSNGKPAPAMRLPLRRGRVGLAPLLAVALLFVGGLGLWQWTSGGDGGGPADGGRVPALAGVRPGAVGGVNGGAAGTAAAAGPVVISVADLLREVDGAAGAAQGAGGEMEQLRQRAAALALAAQQRRERPHEAADKLTEVRGKITDLVRRGELPQGTAERLESHLRTLAQALDEEAPSATAEARAPR